MSEQEFDWTIDNFKGVRHARLPLTGLNVISGKNSAGKSSLTQSLLLIAQSMRDDVVLNGPLVRLGSADDAINESSDSIEFEWGAERTLAWRSSEDEHDHLSIRIRLGEPRIRDKMLGTALVVSELHVSRGAHTVLHASDNRVEAATWNRNNPDRMWGDSLLRVHEIEGRKAPLRTFICFSGLYPSYILYKKERTTLANRMVAELSNYIGLGEKAARWAAREYLFSIDSLVTSSSGRAGVPRTALDEDISALMSMATKAETGRLGDVPLAEIKSRFESIADKIAANDIVAVSLAGRSIYSMRYQGPDQVDDLVIPTAHLDVWQDVFAGFAELRSTSRRVSYIGPLREEPQVLSPTGGRTGSVPAGIKGEYTADLLYRNRENVVAFVDPSGAERNDLLLNAVGVWASDLGVGESVQVVDEGKLGRGIRVNIDGRERDLTTIGVGVSQLLPVITVVLAAEQNAIVLLEQPELHLHPAIQSRLGEFFANARPDLTIVVETHSEYLITRLRRINVNQGGRVPQISFLFAHSGPDGSTIEPLETDSLGDIDEWPEGFFDTQEVEERLLLGALTKRSRGER